MVSQGNSLPNQIEFKPPFPSDPPKAYSSREDPPTSNELFIESLVNAAPLLLPRIIDDLSTE